MNFESVRAILFSNEKEYQNCKFLIGHEKIWLTQQLMAESLVKNPTAIRKYLNNIFNFGKLRNYQSFSNQMIFEVRKLKCNLEA